MNVAQNTDASRSRIEDADYAAETTNLARTQIIAQASTAMLAQANQSKAVGSCALAIALENYIKNYRKNLRKTGLYLN